MIFKQIKIENFRNFENIRVTIENKNVLFGLNDIGKTNFLYALRFLFDRECRRNGLIESDFLKKDITRESNVTAMNKMGIDIKRQDIANCINSIEFLSSK